MVTSASLLCFMIYLYNVGIVTNGILLNGTPEERIALLEEEVSYLRQAVESLQGCATDFCEINWSKWGSWSAWSHCSGQCSGGYSTREQSRQRHRTCLNDPLNSEKRCNGSNVETDTRPCNTVELYGCLNEQNTNTSDGSQYGLVYNFYDELAQSTCTAALTSAAHVSAVRRNCASGVAAECEAICSHLGYTCLDALHVYRSFSPLQPNDHSHTDQGKQGLFMYRYFSCTFGTGSCGPNYCCCKWA